jgi:aconitate hydratase
MAFDIETIKNVYGNMPAKIEAARKMLGRPLTLAEKILYSHLSAEQNLESFERAKTYVNFAPDRVAMQDAPLKWRCYNLCKPVDLLLQYHLLCIAII